jgi:hypothetical protein
MHSWSSSRYLKRDDVNRCVRCRYLPDIVEHVRCSTVSSASASCFLCKRLCTLSVKLSDFYLWRHTLRKNWVICAVLTDNSAGLRTVLSSRLSHSELCSSLRESHTFLILPADTTIASSQGTSVSSNSFSRWASHDIFLFKYHFLLHILRFLYFFSDNIMADVVSKQQTTALFLSTIVTCKSRQAEPTKNWHTWWETSAVPENIKFSFFVQFFTQLNCTV